MPPKSQCKFSLLPSIHFILFGWIWQISRTFQDQWPFFPRLSSPGKCHNKIPGLSKLSRTRTNPVSYMYSILKLLTLLVANLPLNIRTVVFTMFKAEYFIAYCALIGKSLLPLWWPINAMAFLALFLKHYCIIFHYY